MSFNPLDLLKWFTDQPLEKAFAACVASLATVLAAPLYAHRLHPVNPNDAWMGYMWAAGIWGLVFIFTLLLVQKSVGAFHAWRTNPQYKYYLRHAAYWEGTVHGLSDPLCARCLMPMSENRTIPMGEEWACPKCGHLISWLKKNKSGSLKDEVTAYAKSDINLKNYENFSAELEPKL